MYVLKFGAWLQRHWHTVLYIGIGALAAVVVGVYCAARQDESDSLLSTAAHTTSKDLLAGQWAYLPGAGATKGGLSIAPEHFAIVQQDGSGGQANPPVNLYGTRLDVHGDFVLSADIADSRTGASLWLYGQVPLIADEFRIERQSLELRLDGTALHVRLWDGSSQNPVEDKSFGITGGSMQHLTLVRAKGMLSFIVNRRSVGAINEHAVFNSQQLWFGADAPGTSGWTLAGLRASGVNGGTVAPVNTTNLAKYANPAGLQSQTSHKRPGFTIGAAMALAPAVSDSQYAQAAFGGMFGAMTTENALKWQFVEPQPGHYDFHEADALVAIAQHYGLKVQGHTLVFGEANPAWVHNLPVTTAAQKQKVEQIMLDHIKTVAGHYRGKMATWDVVNEPLADYDTFDAGSGAIYRNHIWYQAMGPGYIAKAFQAARRADPHALLFLNEYGLEADGDRWNALVSLVTNLKREGVPVDGIGFQAHVYDTSDLIDPAVLRRHIQQLAALGLKSRISEMDVYNDDGPAVQAQQYSSVLQACLSEPSCVSFTTWGISDRYDYFKDDNGSIQTGQDFLFNDLVQPGPALSALQEVTKP